MFKFVAILFCFMLNVLPITQTSKGPEKIIRVFDCSSCQDFVFFFGVGVGVEVGGLVNDDVTLEGGSPNDYA